MGRSFVAAKVETVCDSSRTVLDRNGTPRILADVATEIPTSQRGLPTRRTQRHDAFMRLPWNTSKIEQLDLVDEASAGPVGSLASNAVDTRVDTQTGANVALPSLDEVVVEGQPLLVPTDCLDEDPANPRTEFPDEELAELAQDVALRGILQPIVVRRAGDGGRYRVLFGAKRLRAAKRAALKLVPVVIGSEAHDVYAQVAENQKRHGLTPLDLARFMRSRTDAGESNAEIARRMGIDLTSVAHHLALLTLPPELDEAFRSGRCTSPRTLYELAKLQKTKPERVKAIVSGEGEITRKAVASLTKAPLSPRAAPRKAVASRRPRSLAGQADDLCARLETLLERMRRPGLRLPQTNWRPCVGAWPRSQASSRGVGRSDPCSAISMCLDEGGRKRWKAG